MPTLYAKKKLEIVVEAPLVQRVLRLLERYGATGYTVLPCLAGSGHGGVWQEGEVSGAVDKRLIMVIAEPALAAAILAEAQKLLKRHAAIYFLSDVEVVRPEHF